MTDFIVVRRPPAPEVRKGSRVFPLLANLWHIRPAYISDLGVNPPNRPNLFTFIVKCWKGFVKLQNLYDFYPSRHFDVSYIIS